MKVLLQHARRSAAAAAATALTPVTNLYDDTRSTTDTGDTDSALGGYFYNNADGAVTSSASITAYATSGRIPCTASQPITISLAACHYAWRITNLGFHNWDSGGTWQGRFSTSPKFVLSTSLRTATITPDHTGWIAVTLRYQPGTTFNLLTPIPAGSMDALVATIMVNNGSAAATYSAYGASGTTSSPSAATDLNGQVCVVRNGDSTWIRTGYDSTYDLVHLIQDYEGSDYDQNAGSFFQSMVLIDKTTAYQLTPGVYDNNFRNTYSSDLAQYIVSDNDPAYRMESIFAAGNHGTPVWNCPTSSHGETFATIGGQRRTIGGNTYIVLDVPSDTSVVLGRVMTGDTSSWTYTATNPGTGTLVHSSGAGDTADITISGSPTQVQLRPSTNNTAVSYTTGSRGAIAANGTYLVSNVKRTDSFDTINPKDLFDDIEAAIGGSRPDFNDSNLRKQFTQYRDTLFGPFGETTVYYRIKVLNDGHTRTSMWPIQLQALQPRTSPSGDTIHLFVPGLLSIPAGDTHTGGNSLDFSAVATITSNSLDYYADSDYFAASSTWADNVQRAPTFFMMGQKNSGGTWIKKLIAVNDPSEGVCADPLFNSRAMFLSTANKLYPQIDGSRSVTAGEDESAVAAFGFMDLDLDTDALVHFTYLKKGGRHGFWWHSTGALTDHAIPMAGSFAGKKITEVVRFTGCSALPAVVANDNTITVTTTGMAGFFCIIG